MPKLRPNTAKYAKQNQQTNKPPQNKHLFYSILLLTLAGKSALLHLKHTVGPLPCVAGVDCEKKTLRGSPKQIKDQIKVCLWGKWKVIWGTEQTAKCHQSFKTQTDQGW